MMDKRMAEAQRLLAKWGPGTPMYIDKAIEWYNPEGVMIERLGCPTVARTQEMFVMLGGDLSRPIPQLTAYYDLCDALNAATLPIELREIAIRASLTLYAGRAKHIDIERGYYLLQASRIESRWYDKNPR